MKRYFSLFLCALLCIGITGCSKGSGSTEVQTYEKSGVTESTIETSENSKNISDEFSDTKETDKNMTDIVDRDGRHIGQIPFNIYNCYFRCGKPGHCHCRNERGRKG